MIPVSQPLPAVGTPAPAFTLTRVDRTDVQLSEYLGKRVVLNIFPSIDTSTCAMSVRRFNQLAAQLTNTVGMPNSCSTRSKKVEAAAASVTSTR